MSVSGDHSSERAVISAYCVSHAIARGRSQQQQQPCQHLPSPRPSASRLASSLNEAPYCLKSFVEEAAFRRKEETVLYLAYGSNLAARKFKGERGIKPLSQINVQVPSLRMTFDLPGVPYSEPCFANSARRDPNNDPPKEGAATKYDEKSALLGQSVKEQDYRKNRWHKGMIGVVYEVTPEDYAHIIATEGGGSAYQDILVACHPLDSSDPDAPVPQDPFLPPFKAHTLFAPAEPEGDEPEHHLRRPDPDYAQASARYLKLITDGAAECNLPYEYQDYLLSLQPYTITTKKQRMGQIAFTATWVPIVILLFTFAKMFTDKNGQLPTWAKKMFATVFQAVWTSYDNAYKPLFGDGERTLGDSPDENGSARSPQTSRRRERRSDVEKSPV
ncbi:hypothetical protein CB0940_10998 [Lecanosticta acicola]|uniref:gamma-glutamylcyclotransferase n=1 Tax=Lecanosticta acicola TaxID=111012 RepID=A0AAI8YTE5_9PEZI|nr:hypothetical protein CB0940_10998 [Lecanosticta acicola]